MSDIEEVASLINLVPEAVTKNHRIGKRKKHVIPDVHPFSLKQ